MPESELLELLDEVAVLAGRLRIPAALALAVAIIVSVIPAPGSRGWVPISLEAAQAVLEYSVPEEFSVGGKSVEVVFVSRSPFIGLAAILRTGLLIGFLTAMPLALVEIYRYARPGLYPWERRVLARALALGPILFLAGSLVGLLVVVPLTMRITITLALASLGGEPAAYADVGQLIDLATIVALSTGLAALSPLIAYALVVLGVVSWERVRSEKKAVFLLSLIIAASVSPDPSGAGMILIGSALFASIMMAAWAAGRRRRLFVGETVDLASGA